MAKRKPSDEEITKDGELEASALSVSAESTKANVPGDESAFSDIEEAVIKEVPSYKLKDNRIYIEGLGTIESKNFTNEHYQFMVEKFGEATAIKYVK